MFTQDMQSAVILRIESKKADRLGVVLSYLSDFGVIDKLEKRYPRVLLIHRFEGKLMWLTLDDGASQSVLSVQKPELRTSLVSNFLLK